MNDEGILNKLMSHGVSRKKGSEIAFILGLAGFLLGGYYFSEFFGITNLNLLTVSQILPFYAGACVIMGGYLVITSL